jgi:hypothetical protein
VERPIDRFWEGFFGTPMSPGNVVVPHAALAGYPGVWFFVRKSCCIVSAPPAWCPRLEQALGEATLDSVMSEGGFRAVFGSAFESSVGPSWLGWLSSRHFQPVSSPKVRRATAPELRALAAACSPQEREAADLRDDDAFGWFEGEEILAAASLTAWGENVAGPGVLSRRPGCGTAVVSATVAEALRDGKLVVYQTLMENERAVGIARRLGFEFYASHLAVRLAS